MTAAVVVEACPDCGRRLRLQRRRSDGEPFIGCVGYPACRFTDSYDARNGRLVEALLAAEKRIHDLQRRTPKQTTPAIVGTVDKKVRDLIFDCHPDRHPRGVDGGRVVAALNELREILKRAA